MQPDNLQPGQNDAGAQPVSGAPKPVAPSAATTPGTPGSATPPTPPPPPKREWRDVSERARTTARIITMLICLVAIGGVVGYVASRFFHQTTPSKPTSVQTLTPDQISKLSEIGTNLGTTGQVLNIGADALFRGKASVTGDLSVGGHLNANGPATLSQVNISGTTAAAGLSLSSNLNVAGTTSLQKSLTVGDMANINGNLTVSGAASMNVLTVSTLNVRSIAISGPLTIGHLATQGPAPAISSGTAVGGGGTVSIGGNDSAGTVNINVGAGAPAGVLANITFRAAYGSTVHVLLSPLSSLAASTPAYVSRSAGGFQIKVDAPPPNGTLSYDYFVTQ